MIFEKKRLHAFDNFRAILAVLGIPFHVALYLYAYNLLLEHIDVNYFHLPISLDDFGFNVLFLLGFYIHVFRMPAFFMLSGFFSHMIYSKKAFHGFVKNRLMRIGIPFLAFIILLIPFGLSPVLLVSLQNKEDFWAVLSKQYHADLLWGYFNHTFNYWFLYYLLWFLFLTVFLLLMLRIRGIQKSAFLFFTAVNKYLSPIGAVFFLFFVSVLSLILVGYWYPVTQNQTFVPNYSLMIFYGAWYFFGWHLWANKNLFNFCMNNAWIKVFFSFLSYCVYLILYKRVFNQFDRSVYFSAIVFYCISMSTGVFGVLGLVYRYFDTYNSIMTYLVKASYWIYLVQIPFLAILFPLIISVPASLPIQFFIGVFACLLCCIISFELGVKRTALFKILG